MTQSGIKWKQEKENHRIRMNQRRKVMRVRPNGLCLNQTRCTHTVNKIAANNISHTAATILTIYRFLLKKNITFLRGFFFVVFVFVHGTLQWHSLTLTDMGIYQVNLCLPRCLNPLYPSHLALDRFKLSTLKWFLWYSLQQKKLEQHSWKMKWIQIQEGFYA